jgi:hypothetical protein
LTFLRSVGVAISKRQLQQSLTAQTQTLFADEATWKAHLDRLGFTKLDVTPDPVRVATEGALWGSGLQVFAGLAFLTEPPKPN